MRILHCCLASFYIDNYGYQENILPKFHKIQGHEVSILASCETYLDHNMLGYVRPKSYINEYGIEVKRVPYTPFLPHFISRKIRIYSGVSAHLREFEPEIIFIHDCQFLSIREIALYAKCNNTVIFADCHTDFVNSATNFISKYLLHKIIYKFCFKIIEKYTLRFYGTTPSRMDFLKTVYGINQNKIKLLPFGYDDSILKCNDFDTIRTAVRKRYGLKSNDFIFVTGGKIDLRKNIHLLLEAIDFLCKTRKYSNVKLVVFGRPNSITINFFEKYQNSPNIIFIDWLDHDEINQILLSSDFAIFPGTHSVLWEQAVGLGIPAIFHQWKGIQHLDLDGNCIFIKQVTVKSLVNTLKNLLDNPITISFMKKVAKHKGPAIFSYSKIAEYSIQTD